MGNSKAVIIIIVSVIVLKLLAAHMYLRVKNKKSDQVNDNKDK